jgi:hypothetical protein
VALVRTDVLEERSVSIIRVTRIGELGTALAVTRNRRRYVPPKRRFLKEIHGVTFQKTPFFIEPCIFSQIFKLRLKSLGKYEVASIQV